MGMLAPAAGLQVVHSVLACSQALMGTSSGVLGGASASYWRGLLRAAGQAPALFEAVAADDTQQVSYIYMGNMGSMALGNCQRDASYMTATSKVAALCSSRNDYGKAAWRSSKHFGCGTWLVPFPESAS